MIPLSTTTIAVLRSPSSEGYDEPYAGDTIPARTPVAAGVRAVIDHATGTTQVAGGQQVIATYQLTCDLADVQYLDVIQDETTGRLFRIRWLIAFPDHIEAELYDTEGET